MYRDLGVLDTEDFVLLYFYDFFLLQHLTEGLQLLSYTRSITLPLVMN